MVVKTVSGDLWRITPSAGERQRRLPNEPARVIRTRPMTEGNIALLFTGVTDFTALLQNAGDDGTSRALGAK